MEAKKKELLREAINTTPNLDERAGQFLKEVLHRSSEDWDFRQQLLTDANAAFAQHLGQEPQASDFNIVFVENKADVTIVLPDPINTEAELSEDELEAVAGGEGVIAVVASVTTVVSTALMVYDAWFDN